MVESNGLPASGHRIFGLATFVCPPCAPLTLSTLSIKHLGDEAG